jgi:hypothetical protein
MSRIVLDRITKLFGNVQKLFPWHEAAEVNALLASLPVDRISGPTRSLDPSSLEGPSPSP